MKISWVHGFRRFLRLSLLLVAALLLSSYFFTAPARGGPLQGGEKKTILLGFDGVDYQLATRFMEEGHLPNLQRLREEGTFVPLATANPAQSPVAWASIVTGTNPGKTNIGGFIKRKFSIIDESIC